MKQAIHLTSDKTEFVLLSFEGPDKYSLAGGLGRRVTQLAHTLARKGYHAHIVFVGDPHAPEREYRMGGRLLLHRCCQWISKYYPKGAYDGEEAKLCEFSESIPGFLLEQIARPAFSEGKVLVILAEEWHTAEVMCRVSDLLHCEGLRDRAVLFWNANSTMAFHRINWGRLAFTTTITTVSRCMKHLMWGLGVNAQVIPNGITCIALGKVDDRDVARMRASLDKDLILCKVAPWGSGQGWNAAIEATAALKRAGLEVVLLAQGGAEPRGEDVLQNASRLGLRVSEACARGKGREAHFAAIAGARNGDIINICCQLPPDFLRLLYRASDAVLANGGWEPFGLVGLEAMASGGIAFTGATGEDYAIHKRNCLVQETGDSWEIVSNLLYLRDHPEEEGSMRRAARRSARSFTWERAVENLVGKVEQQARAQGILFRPTPAKSQPLDHGAPVLDGKAA